MSPSTLSPLLYQELINIQSSRRLLMQYNNPLHHIPQATAAATPPPPTTKSPVDPTEPYSGNHGFDANVVMVLSVLLCALICSLGLNAIIKCALRCRNFMPTPESNVVSTNSNSAETGVKKKALKTFAVVSYSPELNLPGVGAECVICLSEFAHGEKVRLLPKCQHGFHTRCIDKWLNTHSSCPTCRDCLIETCHKIVGSDQASSSQAQVPPPVTVEREGMVTSYSSAGC